MHLRTKLLFGFGQLLLVFAITTGGMLYYFQWASARHDVSARHRYETQKHLNDALLTIGAIHQQVLESFLLYEAGSDISFEGLDDSARNFYTLMDTLRADAFVEPGDVTALIYRFQEYFVFAKRIFTRDWERSGVREEYLQYFQGRKVELAKAISAMHAGINRAYQADLDAQEAASRYAFHLVLLVVSVASVICILLIVVVSGRLTAPLSGLMRAVERVADGDLTFRTRLTGSDELQRLARAFDRMAEDLSRRQDQLDMAEQTMRNLFEHSSVGFFKSHSSGELVLINDGLVRIMGYESVEEARDMKLNTLDFYANLADRTRLLNVLRSGQPVNDMELFMRRKDGSLFLAGVNIHGVKDRQGRLAYLEGLITDKTLEQSARRLQVAKEAAEEASRAKGLFLATMSHEMRTPLHAIIGMADLLGERSRDQEELRFLELLKSSARSLQSLIGNVLDMAKIEAGQVVLVRESFEVVHLLRDLRDIFLPRAQAKGLAFVLHAPGLPSGPLLGDAHRVRQVLINLLDNALKFTETGSVRLIVEGREDVGGMLALRFTVRDTGIGIESANLPTIFDHFAQVEKDDRRRYGGSGLGLAISRHLAQLMGGTLTVSSTHGQGTDFVFSLHMPLAPAEEETSPGIAIQDVIPVETPPMGPVVGQVALPPDDAGPGAGEATAVPQDPAALIPEVPPLAGPQAVPDSGRAALRLLMAEDNENNRLLMELYLAGEDMAIDNAADGREALEKARSNRYDVILMDIQMPYMDGYEATRAIRDFERTARLAPTPIVALTANAFAEDRERAMTAGCTAYLSKPFKKETLLQTIREAMGS